ncbi:hypothetical protein [Streptomyces sp. NPDC090445]|uniref:hypothetical protein n=1 Tax=Streptomyces sp. NPDC090445 TaxID=3365963 RepID=UPI0038287137
MAGHGSTVVLAGADGAAASMRAAVYAAGPGRRQNAPPAPVYVRPVVAAGAAPGVPVAGTTDGIAQGPVAEIREAAERLGGSTTPGAGGAVPVTVVP